jgi:peptide deformylase
MTLKIVSVGDPVLRQRARPLSPEEILSPAIQRLIEEMRETMYAAPGVGLAAPQIGQPLQLAVIEDKAEYHRTLTPAQMAERERQPVAFHAIINPELHLLPGPEPEFFEGCLSLPGFTAAVPRARTVRVECLDHRGQPQLITASGWYARILQHEIDHLSGTIYVDRMRSRSLSTLDNYVRHWKEKPVADVRRELAL